MTHFTFLGKRAAVLWLGSLFTTSLGASAATPIELVWSDPYGLVPAVASTELRQQILDTFSRMGVPIAIRDSIEDAGTLARNPARIVVALRPGDGVHWGLDEEAMAVALGERGGSYAIFVFVDAVRRTLGHPPAPSPRRLAELARALTRVVAHEVVHVLAPDRGHAGTGLMSRKLTRKLLLEARIELDLTSLVRARDGAFRFAQAAESSSQSSLN